jgi:hypothetical protein
VLFSLWLTNFQPSTKFHHHPNHKVHTSGPHYKGKRDSVNPDLKGIYRRQEQDLLRARRLKNGTGFIQRILEHGLLEDGAECYGFVVFRTGCYDGEAGASAWRKFREHFDKVAQVSALEWWTRAVAHVSRHLCRGQGRA